MMIRILVKKQRMESLVHEDEEEEDEDEVDEDEGELLDGEEVFPNEKKHL